MQRKKQIDTFRLMLGVATALPCFFQGIAVAVMDSSPFMRTRELTAPESSRHKVASFVLDDDMFARTSWDYGDIRVVDDRNAEVPCLPRRRIALETDVDERTVALTVVSLERIGDDRIDIVVRKDDEDEGDFSSLTIRTDLTDFEKRVSVDASNDRRSWEPVAESALIYDYSRYVSLRQARIDVDLGPFTFYRLRISGATESLESPLRKIMRDRRGGEMYSEQEHLTLRRRDFRIESVAGVVRETNLRRKRGVSSTRKLDELDVATDDETGDTLVTFGLPRLPVRRVTLDTESANFVRPVTLEAAGEGDDSRWRSVGSATFVSVEVGDVHRRELNVNLRPSARHERYRLRIKNGDSPPLSVSSVTVSSESWEVLFFHEPGRTYRTYYGNREMSPPSYDIDDVVSRVLVSEVDYYFPSVAGDNPDAGKQASKPMVSGKTAMIVVTVVAVAVLILLIARAVRAVET